MFTEWVLAEADGDDELPVFIEERFTPEFAVAFDAWIVGDSTERGPLAMKEYVPPGTEDAAELAATADAKFDEALENNQRGDNYSLLTVLFALVLFLTAMSQRHIAPWIRRVLLGPGIVVGIVGIVIMLTFPIKI